ncbi:DTW domain-containing protein [Oxalobacteraceae sp. CFBP 13708]|nr:DTW domain-containing protein [Oxalobacteraceae sp. CFBP 13708]
MVLETLCLQHLLREQSSCFCQWITPVHAQAHLLILQHLLEVGNAKNSARLLHLCVNGSVMATGEAFDAGVLDSLLHADGRTPVLLYPATPDDTGLPVPPTLPALPAKAVRLVLLDATWRKSRKMLYLNPALQRLPRLGLTDVAPLNYRIRKAHAPLLDAFDGFVAQQAAYVHARAAGSLAGDASRSDEQDVNRLAGH